MEWFIGEYLAIKLFLDEPIIFLIKDKKTADMYKEKFLQMWNNSIEIPALAAKTPRKK